VVDGDHGSSIDVAGSSVYPPMGDAVPTKVGVDADLGWVLLARVRA
jgi:hypothetical protein